MTARGTPVIYYGDEIGMEGGDDPDNRRDFPGGWPGDQQNAFSASGRTAQQTAVFDFTRKLTGLRAQLSPLRRGEMLSLAESPQAWVYARRDGSGTVLIAINNGAKDVDLTVPLAGSGDTFRGVLNGGRDVVFREGSGSIHLPAGKAEIYTTVSSAAK
jgi:glycosidase